MTYQLRAPSTAAEWAAYHEIRRRVLFELRGRGSDYDATHPDELKVGHYPLVLFHEGQPTAVIRVDVEHDYAVFRRVAVREDAQRRGHGRHLLAAAEQFVREHGCRSIVSHVDSAAVGFYSNCGFRPSDKPGSSVMTVRMTKTIGAP
jgi:GNAT superfamily N-acetyltransferase